VLDLVDLSNRILAPFSFPSFQNEYAARVQDFRSYHSICRDIVTRWVYPLVPDAQLLPGSTYTHTKRYTYREQGVKVSRSAVIGEAVVLSKGAVVGDNAQLRRTIVGRDCVIGANTKISNSHIWKGTLSSVLQSTEVFDSYTFVVPYSEPFVAPLLIFAHLSRSTVVPLYHNL
jgi:hypothetical protein